MRMILVLIMGRRWMFVGWWSHREVLVLGLGWLLEWLLVWLLDCVYRGLLVWLVAEGSGWLCLL